MQLKSFVAGEWQVGSGPGMLLRDATTGEVIANASADGHDRDAGARAQRRRRRRRAVQPRQRCSN